MNQNKTLIQRFSLLESGKYGKTIKNAIRIFIDTLKEEEKISKKDLDNLSDNIKVGVMAAAKINYDK